MFVYFIRILVGKEQNNIAVDNIVLSAVFKSGLPHEINKGHIAKHYEVHI